MRKPLTSAYVLAMTMLWSFAAEPAAAEQYREIDRTVLLDKVRGGWAGQMIGVAYGAPTEFKSNGKIIETNLNGYQDWSPDRIRNAIEQDDLYVEMTFAEVMDAEGLDATIEQYGAAFRDSKYPLWHGNAGARRLLRQGVPADLSGRPEYNTHAYDIDFQIEADFIGLMSPGMPAAANLYAERVGRVMSSGDGLYGGMFVAGMYAAAYFESDPRKVVEQGLKSIPKDSRYAAIIRDVLRWSAENPDDWESTWRKIERKWNKNSPCPDNALHPFNIDAKLNGAYIALGLLYGRGDFRKTMEVSIRSGQDSDCNPSSAAGILGVMLGYDRIPEEWRSGIPAIADEKFSFTNYSFNSIVQSTLARVDQVVVASGGRVNESRIIAPVSDPAPPTLEHWSLGVAKQRVEFDDPAWTHSTEFAIQEQADTHTRFLGAEVAGAEAALDFRGSGIAVSGIRDGKGGQADVFLDGRKVGRIDAWGPPDTWDYGYWHASGLGAGDHRLVIVVSNAASPFSEGRRIGITNVVVYE